jgi:hypothetical protein
LQWCGNHRRFLSDEYRFLGFPGRIAKWRYCIIDLTFVEAMNINSDDIRSVAQQNKRIASLTVPGVLLAVASPSDLGFGLARISEVLIEDIRWETMVFRSRDEANRWIERRAKEKFGLDLANELAAT